MTARAIRYTIREGQQTEAERALWTFLRSVRSAEPGTDYRVYRHDDGLTFLHVATFIDGASREQHVTASYTRQFLATLRNHCEEATPEEMTPYNR